MGTRGLYGVRKGGIDKVTYNHYDSYPDWLGRGIVGFVADMGADKLGEFFDAIKLVGEVDKPTEDEIKWGIEHKLLNTGVSSGSADDWYCLVRELQGNFGAYRKLFDGGREIYMIDNLDFIKDSLFCEYAYIVNLDTNRLEFYAGFQRYPQEGNRYGTSANDDGYYPCALLREFAFSECSDVDAVVETMSRLDNERFGEVE